MQRSDDEHPGSERDMAQADVANGEGDPDVLDTDSDEEQAAVPRRDPDAPGNFVNDETADEVPEPNEPA